MARWWRSPPRPAPSGVRDEASHLAARGLPAQPHEWPAVGQQVTLIVGRNRSHHRSEVLAHDVGRGVIELAPPRIGSESLAADAGDEVVLTWPEACGLVMLSGSLVGRPARYATWLVEPTGPRTCMDRRRYPRALWRSRALIRLATGTRHDVAILDVSEGGLRVLASSEVDIGPGAPIDVALLPDDRAMRSRAKVTWRRLHGGQVELGVAFESLDRRNRGRLRRLVERLLRHLR
jgi:hypothetical protein